MPWLAGHNVNRGVSIACELVATIALTLRVGAVLQTQTETLIAPPGDVFDSCRKMSAVTQIRPGWCVLLCVGDGLGVAECVRE